MDKEKDTTNGGDILDESYSALQLGNILPETEGYRAVEDAIEFGRDIRKDLHDDITLIQIGDMSFHGPYDMTEIIDQRHRNLEGKIEKKMAENVGNTEYTKVFLPLYRWIEYGFYNDEVSSDIRLRYIEEKFEIKNEKKSLKNRFNLKRFLKRK